MRLRKRNKVSLSHYKLFSCKMGYLIPIGLTEVLPGDSIQQATSLFIRFAPLVTPVMHPVHVRIHHWYVPLRLVWDEFEDFITGGPDGLNVSEMPVMTSPSGGYAVGSLADYLGIPPGVGNLEHCALPFRAYDLIYNEWYRDQDLEQEIAISTDSGADTTTSQELMLGDWGRDYFTTSRPWPQKGPQVTVPVNYGDGSGPSLSAITITGSPSLVADAGVSFTKQRDQETPEYAWGYISGSLPHRSTGGLSVNKGTLAASATISPGDPGIGSVDINQLREAFALQRFEEARARYGSRYVEYLRYLGVKSSDARLQRPEYLGGGRQTIQFSEVLQTAEGSSPVGTLRGHGIGAMRSNRYRRFIEEHGYIISLMLIRPISVYMDGLPRLWNRRVKEDFFQKELQHIGQQEVLTKELYAKVTDPDKVFGYQNRYDEYRSHESSVASEFRTVLDSWHLARSFANEPVLNGDFISSVPSARIFAAQENDTLYCMANHSIQARRIISRYGNPI